MTTASPPSTLPGFRQRVTSRRPAPPQTEMVVDIFAGAGGASLGIEAALGRSVDRAINHNPLMIQMHEANHPGTTHLPGDVWDYRPLEVTGGRPVGLLWASPDCTHFSRAKGGRPVSKKIRALAWVVIRWAQEVRPRVIILENVPEFVTWGPLGPDGRPRPERKGETFRRWKRSLERAGYEVQHRELVAADYGVPTIRKRFFLVARCDGRPIVWPQRTHAPRGKAGDLGLRVWRSAAECIDWSLPCPSIFERRRPLAEATCRRIANGIRRYVIDAAEPFIVTCNHGGTAGHVRSAADPMRTLTASRDAHGLVTPVLVGAGGPAYSGKPVSVDQPIGTLTAENHRALVAPVLLANTTGNPATAADEPLKTVTTGWHHAVVAPVISQLAHGDGPPGSTFGDGRSKPIDAPVGTIHAGGGNHALVGAFLAKHYGGVVGQSVEQPAGTVTAKDHHSLVAASLCKLYGTSRDGQDCVTPMPTVTAGGNHVGEVRAFMVAYYGTAKGTTGGDVKDPMGTVVSRDRFGLVSVAGQAYMIVDIGLRMLTPRELLRAQFGRFADEYVLIGTQAQQVAGIGNSVPPELAEALVKANVKLKRVEVAA